MLLKKTAKVLLVSGAVLALASCGGNKGNSYNSNYDDTTQTAGIGSVTQFYGENITPEQERNLLSKDTLYFDFDRFDISTPNKKIILAYAKKLLENPNLQIRISGHTDERGSREYNIGLGERRAKSVAQVLAVKGIPSSRIVTVSYGKEQPVDTGTSEDAWSKNRRAVLDLEDRL